MQIDADFETKTEIAVLTRQIEDNNHHIARLERSLTVQLEVNCEQADEIKGLKQRIKEMRNER